MERNVGIFVNEKFWQNCRRLVSSLRLVHKPLESNGRGNLWKMGRWRSSGGRESATVEWSRRRSVTFEGKSCFSALVLAWVSDEFSVTARNKKQLRRVIKTAASAAYRNTLHPGTKRRAEGKTERSLKKRGKRVIQLNRWKSNSRGRWSHNPASHEILLSSHKSPEITSWSFARGPINKSAINSFHHFLQSTCQSLQSPNVLKSGIAA